MHSLLCSPPSLSSILRWILPRVSSYVSQLLFSSFTLKWCDNFILKYGGDKKKKALTKTMKICEQYWLGHVALILMCNAEFVWLHIHLEFNGVHLLHVFILVLWRVDEMKNQMKFKKQTQSCSYFVGLRNVWITHSILMIYEEGCKFTKEFKADEWKLKVTYPPQQVWKPYERQPLLWYGFTHTIVRFW